MVKSKRQPKLFFKFIKTQATITPSNQKFYRYGLNHICLNTGGPGSKEEFAKSLPELVEKRVYKNPGGWTNIFIRDFQK